MVDQGAMGQPVFLTMPLPPPGVTKDAGAREVGCGPGRMPDHTNLAERLGNLTSTHQILCVLAQQTHYLVEAEHCDPCRGGDRGLCKDCNVVFSYRAAVGTVAGQAGSANALSLRGPGNLGMPLEAA